MDNIAVFMDTLERIKTDGKLKRLTKKAVASTRIFDEGFVSQKTPCYPDPRVGFDECLTLQAAQRLCGKGLRTAVLNFANPLEPGGGVFRGANAQEEYLCRASNLFPCLDSEQAKPYYRFHRSRLTPENRRAFFASDKLIYSEGVAVFRTDTPHGQEYTDSRYQTDVITCAAPYFYAEHDLPPEQELYALFCSRIRNILEAAIEYRVEGLVLGAFGCGAFHNPPRIVAKAFRDVLLTDRYRYAFREVVFAVKRTGSYCENIEYFETAFSQFPEEALFSEERNKRRFFE